MRTALRLLGTRYGIALVLVVVVLAVIGLGRLTTTHQNDQVGPSISVSAIPTESASNDLEAGDDSLVEPDNGNASPSLSPGAADVSTVATAFISAWLRHTNVSGDDWRAGMMPNATPDLMAKLKDTDPGSVPADTIAGAIQTTDQGGAVWSASVPVSGGIVTLRLIAFHGRWQVDGIDWEPS